MATRTKCQCTPPNPVHELRKQASRRLKSRQLEGGFAVYRMVYFLSRHLSYEEHMALPYEDKLAYIERVRTSVYTRGAANMPW